MTKTEKLNEKIPFIIEESLIKEIFNKLEISNDPYLDYLDHNKIIIDDFEKMVFYLDGDLEWYKQNCPMHVKPNQTIESFIFESFITKIKGEIERERFKGKEYFYYGDLKDIMEFYYLNGNIHLFIKRIIKKNSI